MCNREGITILLALWKRGVGVSFLSFVVLLLLYYWQLKRQNFDKLSHTVQFKIQEQSIFIVLLRLRNLRKKS